MNINLISAVIFYLIILLLIITHRKKFDIQAKIFALYKTKIGLKLMDKIAGKFPKTLAFLGYFGIVIALLGMILIVYSLVQGTISLLLVPTAPATIAPIIPGVKIPGVPFFVPFWYGIITLFLVIVIHEFSHGVIARVHKITIKSSGVGMFAIFPLAFVEPDEEQLKKKPTAQQLSVFSAGPFSNILTGFIALLILSFVSSPLQASMIETTGVYFDEILEGNAAKQAGVLSGENYIKIDDQQISKDSDFINFMNNASPGQEIVLSSEKASHKVILGEHPEDNTKAYLGVQGIHSSFVVKETSSKAVFFLLNILNTFFSWFFILSLGIGLANLIPLGPIDGGKIVYTLMSLGAKGKIKSTYTVFKYLSLFMLLILLFNLLWPYLRHLF